MEDIDKVADEITRLRAQLARAQEREAKLREALMWVNSRWSDVSTLVIVREALSLPSDVTALNERLAAERERCAKVAGEAVCDIHLPTGVRIYGAKAAAAIRALGDE